MNCISANNLEKALLSFYETEYFNGLTDEERQQGNRFLISKCPDKAADVQVLFLNLNPQMALPGENANKPCMRENAYWFDEGWKKSDRFRSLFYVIGEKLKNPNWSYRENCGNIDWTRLKSEDISSKAILAAYAYPLRTVNEDDLKDNHQKAVQASEKLWEKILTQLPKRLKIIVTGNSPFDMICQVARARKESQTMTNRLYRGRPSTIKYARADNIKIVRFPQATLCPLVGYAGKTGGAYTDYAKAVDDAFDYLLK